MNINLWFWSIIWWELAILFLLFYFCTTFLFFFNILIYSYLLLLFLFIFFLSHFFISAAPPSPFFIPLYWSRPPPASSLSSFFFIFSFLKIFSIKNKLCRNNISCLYNPIYIDTHSLKKINSKIKLKSYWYNYDFYPILNNSLTANFILK